MKLYIRCMITVFVIASIVVNAIPSSATEVGGIINSDTKWTLSQKCAERRGHHAHPAEGVAERDKFLNVLGKLLS